MSVYTYIRGLERCFELAGPREEAEKSVKKGAHYPRQDNETDARSSKY